MATEVDICNIALFKVGAERISSLAENNKRAKLCNDLYALERDNLLYSHPWNFAIVRAELSPVVAAPLFGYTKQFQIPSDCLRVIATEYDEYVDTFDYRIEGDKLLCDEATIKVEYIKQQTDVSKYTPKFIEALGLQIAARIAYAMTNSNSLSERIIKEADLALRDARSFDAQESGHRDFRKSSWTDVRL